MAIEIKKETMRYVGGCNCCGADGEGQAVWIMEVGRTGLTQLRFCHTCFLELRRIVQQKIVDGR